MYGDISLDLLLEAAVKRRDSRAVSELFGRYPEYELPFVAVRRASLDDTRWLISEASLILPNYYADGRSLLHSLIPGLHSSDWYPQQNYMPLHEKRTKFRYLLRAKANVDAIRNARFDDYPNGATPLQYAILCGSHYAITPLLKAGASMDELETHERELLWDAWFPCWAACRASVIAMFAANARRPWRSRLPKDIMRLLAQRVWRKRYAMCWAVIPNQLRTE